jgi:hypothetical protein
MLRAYSPLVVALVACTGCVPVTEPVGAIDKAEPDKALVGTWNRVQDDKPTGETVTVDVPEVKGNPKGLMRSTQTCPGTKPNVNWFFTATVGKHKYVNFFGAREGSAPDFSDEGAFEVWKQSKKRAAYRVFHYTVKGDDLRIDAANPDALEKVMSELKWANISENSGDPLYETPAGELAKYLDKNGPDKLFVCKDEWKYKREKK